METNQLTKKIKKDFYNSLGLVGIIPLLVFLYILFGKIANFSMLFGEIGYIILATVGVFATGVMVGRKMLMSVIIKLIDDNQRILSMQQELVEQKSLAAITETVFALGDQVNNPLLAIRGNLDLLELDLNQLNLPENIKKRLVSVRSNCERIGDVTRKMSQLSRPRSTTIHGSLKMVDLNNSI